MRKIVISSALLASSISFAAVPINGWYSSLFGGYAYVPDNITTLSHGFFFNQLSYDPGYNAGLRWGYQSNPLRYEGEVTYIGADVKQLQVNGFNQRAADGQIMSWSAMANIYYDFPEIIPAISPFLGAGLGFMWVQTSLGSDGPYNIVHFKRSDTTFAYQGTVGLTYNFSDNYAINVAYRYIATPEIDNFGKNVQSHLASGGVIYRFDTPNYK